MNKKIILIVVVSTLIAAVFFLTREEEVNETKSFVNLYSTLEEEKVQVYSSENSKNSFYFLIAFDGVSVDDVVTTLEFDQNVAYEINYQNVKERNSLPIEYYLAKETEFDFTMIKEFEKYLSDIELDVEYEVNEEFDEYIDGYNDADEYRQFLKSYNLYMVEIKLLNPVEVVNLSNIEFSSLEEVGEETVSTVFYSQEIDVDFLNVAKSASTAHKISNQTYSVGQYYNGLVSYSFDVDCLQGAVFGDFKVNGHKVVDVNAYKGGMQVNEFACKADTTITFEIVYEDDCEFCSSSQVIKFDVNGKRETYYTPQIFAPHNLMLVKSEDIDGYASYLEYVFYSK